MPRTGDVWSVGLEFDDSDGGASNNTGAIPPSATYNLERNSASAGSNDTYAPSSSAASNQNAGLARPIRVVFSKCYYEHPFGDLDRMREK